MFVKVTLCLAVAFAIGEAKTKKVCYDGVGCFTDDAPFSGMPLPMSPEKIKPTWYLYRGNEPARKIQSADELNMDELIVFAHGLKGGFSDTLAYHVPIIRNLTQARPNADALFVDWEAGAAFGFGVIKAYTQPASNTRLIGRLITQFLETSPKFNPSNTYCIGFSLGAHVCSFFGKSVTKGRLARITGLDPALPYFDKDEIEARIDKTDADYVDIYHSSWVGLQRQVGHVDFYLNNGMRQPGCVSRRRRSDDDVLNYDFSITTALKDFFGCSHYRAPYVFATTINPIEGCSYSFCTCPSMDEWKKGNCETCDESGRQTLGYYSINNPNRGAFYGRTDSDSPFCFTK